MNYHDQVYDRKLFRASTFRSSEKETRTNWQLAATIDEQNETKHSSTDRVVVGISKTFRQQQQQQQQQPIVRPISRVDLSRSCLIICQL